EVRRHKGSPFGLVARIDREREEVAERVRIDVTGRVDEVGYVAPPRRVIVGNTNRVAEHRPLCAEPLFAEPRGGELPLFTPQIVHRVLEAVHGSLPEDARRDALDGGCDE